MASERDGLLVTETTGRPLGTLDPGEIDDQLLEGIWGNAGRLHALGVAHRRLDASRILIRPDRTPAFGDFAGAAVAAAADDLAADRAGVLVATALAAGPQRAASAALAALGDDTLTQVLPLLQPAALERQTRHAIADQDWDLDDLRKACAEAAGAELPKLAQLRRVSLRSIGVVVLIGLVAYAIISALADVGLANLIEEFKAADLGVAGRRAGAVAGDPDGEGLRDPRGLVPAPAVRARPHARLRHPVHRPGRAQLGGQARPGYPLLRAQRHRRWRRRLHQRDHQRLWVRRPGPAHCDDQPVGAGVPGRGGAAPPPRPRRATRPRPADIPCWS